MNGITVVQVGAEEYMPTHAAPRESPCQRCGHVAPEGATVWYSQYWDVLCDACIHLAAAGVPVEQPPPFWGDDPFACIPQPAAAF